MALGVVNLGSAIVVTQSIKQTGPDSGNRVSIRPALPSRDMRGGADPLDWAMLLTITLRSMLRSASCWNVETF